MQNQNKAKGAQMSALFPPWVRVGLGWENRRTARTVRLSSPWTRPCTSTASHDKESKMAEGQKSPDTDRSSLMETVLE